LSAAKPINIGAAGFASLPAGDLLTFRPRHPEGARHQIGDI